MSRARRITSEDPIWEEVKQKEQERQLVVAVSQDPLVREVLGLFVECSFDDQSVEKDCKRALRRYVINLYDTSPNQCVAAFHLAEQTIGQEVVDVDG